MEQPLSQVQETLEMIKRFQECSGEIVINGKDLGIADVLFAAENPGIKVTIADSSKLLLYDNSNYLQRLITNGKIIYGVNTGYGGSADVRSDNITAVQKGLIRHLNAGFGDVFDSDVVRAVMLVRANSLCQGYSGVRQEVVDLLVDLLKHDIIPVVPKRGSISASGDLMPTSYIAACMMGRPDLKVLYKGEEMMADEALKQAKLMPITFITKEALAVVNSASFASSMAANVLYNANVAVLLTEAATAMSVESLCGKLESFHSTIHEIMPHRGQKEAARNIGKLLHGSKLTVQELAINRTDTEGVLKQDRYALRTSPQWLAPILETLQTSVKRITIEINSANDNPIIDHRKEEILHGGNFQGISIAVAMDQTRQALQLCGKLLFAQLSEILNWKYSEGLPPNLSGCDINTDFGFKGMDIAMASYCAELDYITNPLTNHVLSAEMHNQSINSMALVSSRMTHQALEILQMMLANIFCAHIQAIDLRWLEHRVYLDMSELVSSSLLGERFSYQIWPWYKFAFTPRDTFAHLSREHVKNGLTEEEFVSCMSTKMEKHLEILKTSNGQDLVADMLGQGVYISPDNRSS
jgi:phenylalanine ammonia-lyase